MEAPRATMDELLNVQEGQAELIGGKIVRLPGHGYRVGCVSGEIMFALHRCAESAGVGIASSPTLVYAVPEMPSGRESFSGDWGAGLRPASSPIVLRASGLHPEKMQAGGPHPNGPTA